MSSGFKAGLATLARAIGRAQHAVASAAQAIPGWPHIEETAALITRPVRDLADGALRVVPAIRRAEWLLETERLKKMHPVMLAVILAFVIKRGLNTTNLGHIGTDPIIYPLLSSVSVFNPFLGVVCGAAFGIGDLIQKLFVNDMYGTNGRDLNYVGAMVGYVFAYSAVMFAGVFPGVLSRVGQFTARRLMQRMVFRRNAAAADGVGPIDRPWNIYWRQAANGAREYSVSKDILPGWYISEGPFAWEQAASRMAALGVPGWGAVPAAAAGGAGVPPAPNLGTPANQALLSSLAARGLLSDPNAWRSAPGLSPADRQMLAFLRGRRMLGPDAAQQLAGGAGGGPAALEGEPLGNPVTMAYPLAEATGLIAGAALGGWSVMQVAPTMVLPAFYLRPTPDVSCHALEATQYGTDRAPLVAGVAGLGGPLTSAVLNPVGGAPPPMAADAAPVAPPPDDPPMDPTLQRWDRQSAQFHQDSIAIGQASQTQRMADEGRADADRVATQAALTTRWRGVVHHAAGASPDAIDALTTFRDRVVRPDGSIDATALDALSDRLRLTNLAQQMRDSDNAQRMSSALDNADRVLGSARFAGQLAAGFLTGGMSQGMAIGGRVVAQAAYGALYGGINAAADGQSVSHGVMSGAAFGSMAGLTRAGQLATYGAMGAWDARHDGAGAMVAGAFTAAASAAATQAAWTAGGALMGRAGSLISGPWRGVRQWAQSRPSAPASIPRGAAPLPRGAAPMASATTRVPRQTPAGVRRDLAEAGMDPTANPGQRARFQNWLRDQVRNPPARPGVPHAIPHNPGRAPGPPARRVPDGQFDLDVKPPVHRPSQPFSDTPPPEPQRPWRQPAPGRRFQGYNPPEPGGPPRQVLHAPNDPRLAPPERRGPNRHIEDFRDIADRRRGMRSPDDYPPQTALNAPPAPYPAPNAPANPPRIGVVVPRDVPPPSRYAPHNHPGYRADDPRGHDFPAHPPRRDPVWDPPEAKPPAPPTPPGSRQPWPSRDADGNRRGQGWDDGLGSASGTPRTPGASRAPGAPRSAPDPVLQHAGPDNMRAYDVTPPVAGIVPHMQVPTSKLPRDIKWVPQVEPDDCAPSIVAALNPDKSAAAIARDMGQYRVAQAPGPNTRHLAISGLQSAHLQPALRSAGVHTVALDRPSSADLRGMFHADPNERIVAAVNLGGRGLHPNHVVVIHNVTHDPQHGTLLHLLDPARGNIIVPAHSVSLSNQHMYRVVDIK
jgi:hypothetical protein